jgi:hypothetical protein
MPTLTIKADMPRFAAAIRNKIIATKKAEAEIINHALKNVAYRAAQFTPKSTVAKVNSISTVILAKLAARYLKKHQGRYTKEELRAYMLKIVKARRQRIAALRVGWATAIKAFGGSFRGGQEKGRSTANDAYVLKANSQNLSGLIMNTIVTRSADGKHEAGEIDVAIKALERAIEFVTDDIEGYATKKFIEALK